MKILLILIVLGVLLEVKGSKISEANYEVEKNSEVIKPCLPEPMESYSYSHISECFKSNPGPRTPLEESECIKYFFNVFVQNTGIACSMKWFQDNWDQCKDNLKIPSILI